MTTLHKPLQRLHIEVTNVCNFKCEFCPDAIMGRARGHMDPNLLEQILDEVATDHLADIITFHLMGEPMIYPTIFEAIAQAIHRRLNLHLTTNGSTFALKPNHIDHLVASGIPKVTISLQTPDPDTFTIRGAPPRLTPTAYFEGITQYLQAHLQSNTPTRVHIKFLDTTPHPFLVPHKSLSVIDGETAMRQELTTWATRIFANLNHPNTPSPAQLQHRIRQHRSGQWQIIELTPRLAFETFPLDSWGNVEKDQVIPATFGYCNGASQQAGVLYDGTVVPCCKDYEGLIPLGHVTEAPLREILNGSSACGLRQGFDQFKIENPVCQRCIGADTQQKAWLRQIGSIAYFKLYRPLLQRLRPGWGEV